jgi:DNA (cytosine-5)-methyltransferase 1
VIMVENVAEFEEWGDADGKGKRQKSKRGKTFMAWVRMLESFGYRVDWRILCAADYGLPTTRKRLFIQALRKPLKIVWPEPTHARQSGVDLLGSRQPWRPARDIIDWSLKGKSIFDRKKPLKPKTLARIQAGLERFGLQDFLITPTHSGSEGCRVTSVDRPLGTVPCSNRFAIAQPFLVKLRGGSESHIASCNSAIDQPVPTISAGGTHVGLVEPMLVPQHGGDVARPVSQPSPTVATKGAIGLIEPYLIQVNHDGGNRVRSTSDPLPTVCGRRGEMALIEPFLVKYYATGSAQSVDDPLDTVTTKPRFGLVRPEVIIEGERYVLDILFRMLQPHELAGAQGFEGQYQFSGTKEDVVRQIGNAVPPGLAKALVTAVLSQSNFRLLPSEDALATGSWSIDL